MRRIERIRGFTLLEMLTAIAIIAILIGLLIPAISKMQTIALNVKQKAQFNAIGAALEAFRSDSSYKDYPPSGYTDITGTANYVPGNTQYYSGAQKLAEALVGWDGLGYHPKSAWRYDGKADFNGDGTVELIYDAVNGVGSSGSLQSAADNAACRQGPYMELEQANAVKLSSIYTSSSLPYCAIDTYILADVFKTVKNRQTGGRTGMPILYFRADTSKLWASSGEANTNGIPTTRTNCMYNIYDNMWACGYMTPTGSQTHPITTAVGEVFYRRIRNPNFPGTAANKYVDARPYRPDSFILLSAGPDALYGTPDDVYNFDEN